MFIHFEREAKHCSYNDNPITSLSWMRHESTDYVTPPAPDNVSLQPVQAQANLDINNNGPEEDNASVDSLAEISRETFHEMDGWLAVGNCRGIVGVSFTSTNIAEYRQFEEWNRLVECSDSRLDRNRFVLPKRTNYNLRGHRSEITFVRWNEPYQKLASCDKNGVIFVWIKYEGRWSIELINDRNTKVTDFSWSHDGRMALICYMDGFVLVGSVSGQRYWSSMLNLNDCSITCGVWTPNDQKVLFGTSNGHILVISVHGSFVAQTRVQANVEIKSMLWSCKRFLPTKSTANGSRNDPNDDEHTLAMSFVDGSICLLRSYDDLFPTVINTDLLDVKMEWSNETSLLAVAGYKMIKSNTTTTGYTYVNMIHFYNISGVLLKSISLDYQSQPLSAIVWGNKDSRIYVACGQRLFVGCINIQIPTLTYLCRMAIYKCLQSVARIDSLPVPDSLQSSIKELFINTIYCHLPDKRKLREFVLRPPANNTRLYCTLIRHDEDSASTDSTYILYLEYLGGLVPILKGKRSSKLKPEFVIYDPVDMSDTLSRPLTSSTPLMASPLHHQHNHHQYAQKESLVSSDSEAESSESFVFPYLTPKTRRRLRCRSAQLTRHFRQQSTDAPPSVRRHKSSVVSSGEEMPESNKIVLITSNIWGTRFKFLGLSSMLPPFLGSITYRTSLLHLQPRQMTLVIKELNEENTLSLLNGFEINRYNCIKSLPDSYSLVSSDSEDDYSSEPMRSEVPTIVPITPHKTVRNSMLITQPPPPPPEVRDQRSEAASSSQVRGQLSTSQTEEYLTLQINQSDTGRPTYNLEISSSSSGGGGSTSGSRAKKQPEVFDDATGDESPVSAAPTSTLVRQFKHQAFHSESPKHVSYFRQSYRTPATSMRQCSPNISPNKNIRSKILKESPRKSSVSYCSREFSTKSYVETVCDIEPVDVAAGSASTGYKVLKFKSCATEAHATSNNVRNNGLPEAAAGDGVYLAAGEWIQEARADTRPKIYHQEQDQWFQEQAKRNHVKTYEIYSDESEKQPTDSIGTADLSANYLDDVEQVVKQLSDKLSKQEAQRSKVTGRNNGLNRSMASLVSINSDANTPVANCSGERIGKNRSLPASPMCGESRNRRTHFFTSPSVIRKMRRKLSYLDCSSEEENSDEENGGLSEPIGGGGGGSCSSCGHTPNRKWKHKRHHRTCAGEKQCKEFTLHNKAPLWNEVSQVYQLDFGGRVTQESAKNFQIEHQGKQVMQFGRIDQNAYTLDFEYPFTAIQALSVALANVTQRLK